MQVLAVVAACLCIVIIVIGVIVSVCSVATRHSPMHKGGVGVGLALVAFGMVFFYGGKGESLSNKVESEGALYALESVFPTKPAPQSDLDKLVDDFAAMTGWGKLLVYRIIMRQTLLAICVERKNARCLGHHSNIAFRTLLEANKDVLGTDLHDRLDKVRVLTHYAEWGEGRPPTRSDIEIVLDEAPEIIKSLRAKEDDYRVKN